MKQSIFTLPSRLFVATKHLSGPEIPQGYCSTRKKWEKRIFLAFNDRISTPEQPLVGQPYSIRKLSFW